MSVKRYQPAPFTERVLHASDDGEYVKHEDYAALEATCAALAAENAGLKVACGGDGSYRDCPACTHSEYIEAPDTPATDAFLAEVRAQGVERLANAWYAIANETDPGISISDSSRLKYRQRADDAADFANEIRQEAAQ
ncbi:hypothetical protein ABKV35_00070 [Enterobacter kobei]|uniref:hypothetical protein n=1 Tax=Enterobacter kobei TaxID=208224 RepID=UPI0032AEB45C